MVAVNEAMGFRPVGAARRLPEAAGRTVAAVRVGADEWETFRDVRLASLADAPEAFGATYADWVDASEDALALPADRRALHRRGVGRGPRRRRGVGSAVGRPRRAHLDVGRARPPRHRARRPAGRRGGVVGVRARPGHVPHGARRQRPRDPRLRARRLRRPRVPDDWPDDAPRERRMRRAQRRRKRDRRFAPEVGGIRRAYVERVDHVAVGHAGPALEHEPEEVVEGSLAELEGWNGNGYSSSSSSVAGNAAGPEGPSNAGAHRRPRGPLVCAADAQRALQPTIGLQTPSANQSVTLCMRGRRWCGPLPRPGSGHRAGRAGRGRPRPCRRSSPPARRRRRPGRPPGWRRPVFRPRRARRCGRRTAGRPRLRSRHGRAPDVWRAGARRRRRRSRRTSPWLPWATTVASASQGRTGPRTGGASLQR